jgi:hypothetical protein
VHPEVAHFAALATVLAERNGSRDMVNLFEALLEEFRAAGEGWAAISVDDVWRRYQAKVGGRESSSAPLSPASDALRQRFARLVQPLSLEATFADGWRFGRLRARPGLVELELQHAVESRLVVELVPRGRGQHFRRSRHYDIRAAGRDFTAAQREALAVLTQVILENDL